MNNRKKKEVKVRWQSVNDTLLPTIIKTKVAVKCRGETL